MSFFRVCCDFRNWMRVNYVSHRVMVSDNETLGFATLLQVPPRLAWHNQWDSCCLQKLRGTYRSAAYIKLQVIDLINQINSAYKHNYKHHLLSFYYRFYMCEMTFSHCLNLLWRGQPCMVVQLQKIDFPFFIHKRGKRKPRARISFRLGVLPSATVNCCLVIMAC